MGNCSDGAPIRCRSHRVPTPMPPVVFCAPAARADGIRSAGGRVAQRGGQLRAGAEIELSVGAREVDLHGPLGDEQRLSDLPVALPLGGHLRDPPLTRGQGLDSVQGDPTRTRSGGEQLGLGVRGERRRTADRGELDRAAQVLAGLDAVPASA